MIQVQRFPFLNCFINEDLKIIQQKEYENYEQEDDIGYSFICYGTE